MTRLAYAHAKAVGVELAPLLARAGLTRRQVEDRREPLKVHDQVALMDLIAAETGDDLLGFHMALRCELREGGLYYYVLASSENVLDVFERGSRYTAIVNEGLVQKLVDNNTQIGIGLNDTVVGRHLDLQQTEFWAAVILRLLRELTGTQLAPRRVRLIHARKDGAPEMARFFGCDVEFGADADQLLFDRSVAALPVVNADPHLNRLMIGYCEEALGRRSRRKHSLRTAVENAIVALLPHGKARASAVAQRLGVPQRTLARRLAAEGVSFSERLTELRRRLAVRYLKEDDLSVSEIAWLVGYQDVAAFSNAFKRWTGKAPSEVTR
jgi:AraC-like DNA-binding protein